MGEKRPRNDTILQDCEKDLKVAVVNLINMFNDTKEKHTYMKRNRSYLKDSDGNSTNKRI